jgi:hypothetical protein
VQLSWGQVLVGNINYSIFLYSYRAVTNHKNDVKIDALNSVALELPRPPVMAIVYSSRKFSRTSVILSILRYGPVSVCTEGQNGTSSAGAGSLGTKEKS